MPKPNGKVVATLLTDPTDILFVETETEAEGRTVSNWLRKEIRRLRKQREEERKKKRRSGEENP